MKPIANPPCKFTQSAISGGRSQMERVGSRSSRASIRRNAAVSVKEKICGLADQYTADVIAASRSTTLRSKSRPSSRNQSMPNASRTANPVTRLRPAYPRKEKAP